MSYVWLSNMVKINAYWQVFFLWETRWGYPAPVEKQQSGQIIDLPAEHSTRGAYLGQTKWELCRYYSYYSYYNITTSALGSIFIDFVDFFLLRKQCLCLWFRLIYIYIYSSVGIIMRKKMIVLFRVLWNIQEPLGQVRFESKSPS